jgi:hypothetical protein
LDCRSAEIGAERAATPPSSTAALRKPAIKGGPATKKIIVKLGSQLLHAMEHNDVVAEFDCVTGDDEHPTEV